MIGITATPTPSLNPSFRPPTPYLPKQYTEPSTPCQAVNHNPPPELQYRKKNYYMHCIAPPSYILAGGNVKLVYKSRVVEQVEGEKRRQPSVADIPRPLARYNKDAI